MNKSIYLLMAVLSLAWNPAYAYFGPGMAGGVITVILGIIGAILLALFGILYYPIKRALKKKNKSDSS